MSKKRGVSADEKRSRVLEIFHDSADVFVLKDIEKLAAKKGVILQAVKEVLQSLVDDDLVHQEKIGGSNYFWSFPSEASQKLCNQASSLEKDLEAAKRRKLQLQQSIDAQKKSKPNVDTLLLGMAELRRLRQAVKEKQTALEAYRDNDPETIARMREAVQAAKEGANRWLDNLHSLKSWARKRFSGHERELDAFFEENGFTDNLEYME